MAEKNSSGGVKEHSIKTVSLVMVIMLASKVTGLVRDAMNRAVYGSDEMSFNAFTFASTLPRNFLDIVFASAISASFIPVFNTYLKTKSREEAYKLGDHFISAALVFSGVITAIAMFFPMEMAAIGLDLPQETEWLAGNLLRIILPTIVISATAFSLTGVLQSLGEFNIPAGMSILSNLLILLYYIFLERYFGVYGLAVVFTLGWLTQVIVQIPALRKKGYRYRFRFSLNHPGMREIGLLMLPVMISSWTLPVNNQVNMKIVSRVDGGIMALETANTLYAVVTGVFILSIANVIFPRLSRQKAGDDGSAFSDTIKATVRALFFFLIPMSGGLMVLAEPVIKLLFQRGEFSPEATAQSAYAMFFCASGMVGFGLQTILNRGFYASKDRKAPMFTGLAAMALNLILSLALVKGMGVGGPALGSALSMNLTGFAMLLIMGRRNPGLLDGALLRDGLKMLLSGAVMALGVYGLKSLLESFLPGTMLAALVVVAVPAGAGLAFYMVVCYLLKLNEAKMAFEIGKSILKKREKNHNG